MNTLGLGRYVNTFQLGVPYSGEVPPEPPTGGGGGAFHGQWKKPYDHTEYDKKWEQEQLRLRIQQEDAELVEFISVLLSKGIL